MRNLTIFICFLSCYTDLVYSQPVACTSEQDDKKAILIYATNRTIGTYTVGLNFPILEGFETNFNKDEYYEVPSGKKLLIKLNPAKGVTPDLQFGFKSYEGKVFKNPPEKKTIYLLPAKPGNEVAYLESQKIAERIGKQPPKDYQAYYFQLKAGDTICASRSGVVTKINDDIKQGQSLNATFSANRNQIKIEHKDGTLAQYTFVSPIISLTDVGKEIKAGEPIAVLGQQSDKFGVFFSVYYLDESKLAAVQKLAANQPKYIFTYLPVDFHLKNNSALEFGQSYVVEHPMDLLKMEMSKREK
jgi:Peptidase family M23